MRWYYAVIAGWRTSLFLGSRPGFLHPAGDRHGDDAVASVHCRVALGDENHAQTVRDRFECLVGVVGDASDHRRVSLAVLEGKPVVAQRTGFFG